MRSKTTPLPEMDALADVAARAPAARSGRRRRSSTATSSSTTCMLDPRRRRPHRRGVRLGDERARRSAGRSRHPARLLVADRAARAARRADDGDRPAGLSSRADEIVERYAARSGRDCLEHPLLRDVRALQDRRRHPADLLPLRAGPDRPTRGSRPSARASRIWRVTRRAWRLYELQLGYNPSARTI